MNKKIPLLKKYFQKIAFYCNFMYKVVHKGKRLLKPKFSGEKKEWNMYLISF